MELKIKKQVEETINITFPHYTKDSVANYCFPSEKKCISVTHSYSDFGVIESSLFPEEFILKSKSTKEEFDLAFNEVLEKIKNISRD